MSTEDTPRQVPSGGGNQLSLHDLHYKLLSQHAHGGAPHVWERLPPPLPPGGGGGAEPMSPALLGSSTVNVDLFSKDLCNLFYFVCLLMPISDVGGIKKYFQKDSM